MDRLVADLAAQQAELDGLLAGLDDDDWHRPTRCVGWDVGDVVLHLAQTNEMALGSATGRFEESLAALTDGLAPAASVDEGAARMVERDRDLAPTAIRDRWAEGAAALRDAFAAADPHERVTWVAGQLTVRTLVATRLAETWIHSGDVAAAVDVALPPTGRLHHIARLAWRTLPYAFAGAGRELAGPVAFELRGPGGEAWPFRPDGAVVTTIRGDAEDLCLVAARRVDAAGTGLHGEGPDAEAVLALVRTYA